MINVYIGQIKYILKRISKNIVFTCIPLNLLYLLNYGVKILKKANVYIDQLLYLCYKCQCENQYFADIRLNAAYLLKYKYKINWKGQCLH